MATPQSYQAAAEAYAAEVRAFLDAPATASREQAAARREHGTEPAAAPAALAAAGERLAPVSAQLTQVASQRLNSGDPAERAAASAQLLAKALADLEISRRLLDAAEAEEEATPAAERGVEPALSNDDIEESLRVLLGVELASSPTRAHAMTAPPADVPTALRLLSTSVQDTLLSICDQAGQTGQRAMGGMLALGIGEIAKAAGLVGLDIAGALGQGEKVTRLYDLGRTFALNAYNSLVALFGPTLAKLAAQQTLQWVKQVAKGKQFARLLDKLYHTAQTRHQIDALAAGSQAPLDKYVTAIQAVDGLASAYGQQVDLVNKILTGLSVFGSVSTAVIPNVRLLLAALYIVVAAYTIAAGADYLDATEVKLLDRVPGVREVVEQNLA